MVIQYIVHDALEKKNVMASLLQGMQEFSEITEGMQEFSEITEHNAYITQNFQRYINLLNFQITKADHISHRIQIAHI